MHAAAAAVAAAAVQWGDWSAQRLYCVSSIRSCTDSSQGEWGPAERPLWLQGLARSQQDVGSSHKGSQTVAHGLQNEELAEPQVGCQDAEPTAASQAGPPTMLRFAACSLRRAGSCQPMYSLRLILCHEAILTARCTDWPPCWLVLKHWSLLLMVCGADSPTAPQLAHANAPMG